MARRWVEQRAMEVYSYVKMSSHIGMARLAGVEAPQGSRGEEEEEEEEEEDEGGDGRMRDE